MSDVQQSRAGGARDRQVQRKVFAGSHIRRLRRELEMTQASMADDLGISTSYLNLIERNQRPVSAQLLLRLADVYDLDLKSLAGNDEERALAELKEVFSDPLFAGMGIANQDLQDLAMANPQAAQGVGALYRAYLAAVGNASDLAERLTDENKSANLDTRHFPIEEVRDFIHNESNHFPELESAAEQLWEETELDPNELATGLRLHLERYLGVKTRTMPLEVLGSTLKRYEPHGRRLLLSEMLEAPGRTFQIAHQIAFSGYRPLLDEIVARSGLNDPVSQRLCRVSMANYFAGAVMMPYERFRKSAEDLRYDVNILGQRFGASFEQVCHRLTTMQRSGARGVPFFLIRVDNAGNISKRFSAGGFHFARNGGACPRWNVHDAFQTPGKVFTQVIEMPDGTTYFSIARTVRRTGAGSHLLDQQLAVGLGCEIGQARKIVYADGYNLESPQGAATPIGPNCRLCDRVDCAQRAFPPLSQRLEVSENIRGLSPFAFARP